MTMTIQIGKDQSNAGFHVLFVIDSDRSATD